MEDKQARKKQTKNQKQTSLQNLNIFHNLKALFTSKTKIWRKNLL